MNNRPFLGVLIMFSDHVKYLIIIGGLFDEIFDVIFGSLELIDAIIRSRPGIGPVEGEWIGTFVDTLIIDRGDASLVAAIEFGAHEVLLLVARALGVMGDLRGGMVLIGTTSAGLERNIFSIAGLGKAGVCSGLPEDGTKILLGSLVLEGTLTRAKKRLANHGGRRRRRGYRHRLGGGLPGVGVWLVLWGRSEGLRSACCVFVPG